MAKFDIEVFLKKFQPKMKAALTAKIAAINAEKNDDTNIVDFDSDAWIFQSLNAKAKNYENFVFYYIDDLISDSKGPNVAEEYSIEVDLFICDKSEDDIYYKVLRYWRALKEASQMIWNEVDPSVKVEVESLNPITVQLLDSDNIHKVIGVKLKVSLN